MALAPPPIRTAIGWILQRGRREIVNLDIVFARWLQSITDQRAEDEDRLLPKPEPSIAGKIAKVTPEGDKWVPADDEEGSDLPEPTPSDIGRVLKINAQGVWAIGDDAVGTPGSGEPNVQADWDQADDTADSYIKNKPTIPTPRTDAEIQALIDPAVTALETAINAALALKADLESPSLTGEPHSTTPPDDDRSTRIATTEWVAGRIAEIPATPVTPPTQPLPVPTGFVGWSDDETVEDSELSTAFDTRTIVLPARSDPGGYIVFARTRAPYAIYFEGEAGQHPNPYNVIAAFTQVGTRMLGGVEHVVYRSNEQQNSSIVGTGTYMLRFGG